jgi:hypothetical protein
MPFRDLRDFQDFILGAYVRNVMFFATLPYYLAREIRRNRIDTRPKHFQSAGNCDEA